MISHCYGDASARDSLLRSYSRQGYLPPELNGEVADGAAVDDRSDL